MLRAHRAAVRSCKFSRDNAVIISGGFDRRAIAWVRTAGDTCMHSWERACIIGDYARGITTCAISSDGMVAFTGSWDSVLRLHPLEDVRLHAALTSHQDSLPDSPGPLPLVHPPALDSSWGDADGDDAPAGQVLMCVGNVCCKFVANVLLTTRELVPASTSPMSRRRFKSK